MKEDMRVTYTCHTFENIAEDHIKIVKNARLASTAEWIQAIKLIREQYNLPLWQAKPLCDAIAALQTDTEDTDVKNAGYRAQVLGKDLIVDNPYHKDTNEYWLWRTGWLDAYKDSN